MVAARHIRHAQPTRHDQWDLISNHLVHATRSIASKLIDMEDQNKLRRISRYVNDHLRHPDRDPIEKAIALGMMGTVSLNGPLSKTAALMRYGGEKNRRAKKSACDLKRGTEQQP